MTRTRHGLAALLAAALLTLSACAGGGGSDGSDGTATQPPDSSSSSSDPSTDPSSDASPDTEAAVTEGHDGHEAKPAKARPLRAGETRTTIAMPGSYTPSAPYGTGTDDYRCFLLDP